jgi:hypothetical protein
MFPSVLFALSGFIPGSRRGTVQLAPQSAPPARQGMTSTGVAPSRYSTAVLRLLDPVGWFNSPKQTNKKQKTASHLLQLLVTATPPHKYIQPRIDKSTTHWERTVQKAEQLVQKWVVCNKVDGTGALWYKYIQTQIDKSTTHRVRTVQKAEQLVQTWVVCNMVDDTGAVWYKYIQTQIDKKAQHNRRGLFKRLNSLFKNG